MGKADGKRYLPCYDTFAWNQLEYFDTNSDGDFKTYIHARYTSSTKPGGTWRQPISSAAILPGATVNYGFKFRWAANYQGIRDILIQEGMVDIQVLPGMTIPTDLTVELLLSTKREIKKVEAEFPGTTIIKRVSHHAR
ncbi:MULTISPECIES: DUF5695 domain-containing protein [Mucilaginibacter]|uniref:DUF5695 domain-containing protein n=1 Tax=Mucilaginibacter TaxID=423349 RepID=UPI0001E9DF29|nr:MULTISPECIES: DUF5695 domain-containing protein [Mucilaginibacter]